MRHSIVEVEPSRDSGMPDLPVWRVVLATCASITPVLAILVGLVVV